MKIIYYKPKAITGKVKCTIHQNGKMGFSRQAIKKIGVPKEKILHVAQSIFHDIVPAKKIGLSTVWVNRRHNKKGFGATPEAHAKPDFEVPDLKSMVELLC